MTGGEGSIDVLHVDDDADLAEVAARFLEREDPRLAVATEQGAAAALDRLAGGTFDCVVSDYEMPRMDGLEFFEAIHDRHPDVPFILFTGKGSEAVAGEAVSAGVTDYLQKESSTEQYRLLANRITNAVDQSRTAARLDEERRRFRVLFEQFTQPTVEVEYEGEEPVVRRVNPAFEEVFGYAAGEIVGESLDEYIVPDDHETEAERINSRVQDGARLTAEPVTRLTADGTRAFLLQNAVYPDGSGGFAIYTDVTDRRERERRVERQNARLSALFENFPEPTVAYVYEDGEPTVVEANGAFVDTFADGESSLAGESIDDVVVPPGLEAEARQIDERVQAGDAIDEHIRRQAADGLRDFRFRNVPLPDDDRIDGYAIYADITERRRRDRELRRQNDLFREAQELADVGGWEYKIDADELVWSEQVRRIHDVSDSFEPTLKTALEFYHPEDREKIEATFQRVVTEASACELEARVETAEGDERWIHTHACPTVENGEVVRIHGAVQDITDRKEQLETIRGLQYRTQRLIRASDPTRAAEIATDIASEALELPFAGVHLVDDEWTTLEPAAVTADGRDRLGAAPTYERTDPDRTVDRVNWGVLESGEPAVIEDAHEHGAVDETETPTRSAVVVPLGDHGVVFAASPEPNVLTRFDRYLADILATVLTAALDRIERERRLESQKRLLEERTDRLDELVSVISHDLRSPLSVVAGRLEMARDGTDSRHVERALGAAERSQDIVGDLLTLAREGDRATDLSPVALDDIARDCWRDVTTGTAALAVGTDETVRADRGRLRQLLENLIRNSVEHSSTSPPSHAQEDAVEHSSTSLPSHAREDTGSENASEPSVANAPEDAVEHSSTSSRPKADDTVERGSTSPPSHDDAAPADPPTAGSAAASTPAATDDGVTVTVTIGTFEDGFYVADDGPGIPPEEREAVFESGYSTGRSGTGLGLSIVEQVAREHGWTIGLGESADGGARFEFTGVEFVDDPDAGLEWTG